MSGYPYSRDGEAGVLRGGRERRRARGPGPQQPESTSSGKGVAFFALGKCVVIRVLVVKYLIVPRGIGGDLYKV